MADKEADLGLLMLMAPPIVIIRTPRGRRALQAPDDADGVFLGHMDAEEFVEYLSSLDEDLLVDMYDLAELQEAEIPLKIGLCLSERTIHSLAEIGADTTH